MLDMIALLTQTSQTIKSFEESIRMYAIPAETASQNMPFKKEDLPGPGELSFLLLSFRCRNMANEDAFAFRIHIKLTTLRSQRLYKHRTARETASNCSSVSTITV